MQKPPGGIIGLFPCLNIRPNIRAVSARYVSGMYPLCAWLVQVQKRGYDVRRKATGKDFDAGMYRPHIAMIEAARIFGWSFAKL